MPERPDSLRRSGSKTRNQQPRFNRRFQDAEFHWPLFGIQSLKATVASVPIPVIQLAP
jgi:hypothetical protein